MAQARLEDSRVLFEASRYDAAIYTCGYVVELGLKMRICETLKWDGYPRKSGEFNDYRSFKTHNLDVLLNLSGIKDKVLAEFFVEWGAVSLWNPESRYDYDPVGNFSREEAENMLKSVEKLFKIL